MELITAILLSKLSSEEGIEVTQHLRPNRLGAQTSERNIAQMLQDGYFTITQITNMEAKDLEDRTISYVPSYRRGMVPPKVNKLRRFSIRPVDLSHYR